MSRIEKLRELEASGKYVFHGSPVGDLDILDPKQGTHVPNLDNPNDQIDDGKPAVFATPYLDVAIFRAIINKHNITHRPMVSGFNLNSQAGITFHVSDRVVLNEAREGKAGFVYVFDKKYFEPYDREESTPEEEKENTMEWRSYEPLKPKEVFQVSSDDLPNSEQITVGGE